MKISCAGFIPGHWYYSIGFPWGGPVQVAIPVYATYAKAADGKRVLIGEDAVIPGMSGGPVMDRPGPLSGQPTPTCRTRGSASAETFAIRQFAGRT
jgi:hypothetical protein